MHAADIIIAGGGTAGCILAARLSEDRRLRVILVEAGPDVAPGLEPADIADDFPRAFANPGYFWPGLTATLRAGEPPRAYKQPRLLGGGSSVMGLWALRGLAADYDGWAADGAHGWSYADVLPFFQSIEHDIDFPAGPHGDAGPIPVRRVPRERWPGFVRLFAEAVTARQLAPRDDINGSDEDGLYPIPSSTTETARASSPSQFLTAAVRARKNLDIRTGVHVATIAMDGRKAVGVNLIRADGTLELIGAARVVVSAGGIHSPALLLRSGIGAAQDLRAAGVAPLVDLPGVGRNLQNHVYVHMGTIIRPGHRQPPAARAFAMAGARISSGLAGAPRGDLFLSVMARTMARDPGNQIGVIGGHIYAPASRGTVRLAGADPRAEPVVQFNFLDAEIDRQRLMQIARLGCDVLEEPAMKVATLERFMLPPAPPMGMLNGDGLTALLAGLGVRTLPALPGALRRSLVSAGIGPGRLLDGLGRGEAFERLVLASYTAMFHPTSTCAIGHVVDPLTRVIGTEGLNVVDASIMPSVPRANTNLPTSMLAARAAALIRTQMA